MAVAAADRAAFLAIAEESAGRWARAFWAPRPRRPGRGPAGAAGGQQDACQHSGERDPEPARGQDSGRGQARDYQRAPHSMRQGPAAATDRPVLDATAPASE